MINLDLFSYSIFNSYLVFTLDQNKLLIRNIIDGDEDYNTLAYIDLEKNGISETVCKIGYLKLIGADIEITISYLNSQKLIISSTRAFEIEYSPLKYEFASIINDKTLNVNLYSKKSKMLIVSQNTINVNQFWNVISSDNLSVTFDKGITNISVTSDSFANEAFQLETDVQTSCQKIEEHFKNFWKLQSISYEPNQFEAKYILWSCFVHSSGHLKYDACYMSKNIMTNIWSWDNCFVSLGLAKEQPKRAYEQFMSFYHVQSPHGNYPDFMNPLYVSYDFTKPPIQGILYKELMKINYEYFTEKERLTLVIDSFKRLVEYWTTHRTFNNLISLPYNTHGNDTGLDNASVFDKTVEMRTPDLFVYLIKLMELINELETIINIEKTNYQTFIDEYINELENNMYDGNKFTSYNVHDHSRVVDSMSILELTPLLISEKFENEVKLNLMKNFDNFYTEHGVASESPKSSFYVNDGYWRGPIWAPTTCLIYLGLINSNQEQIAKELRMKYIKLCDEYGYAENFNALTGEGLRDKSFAWTAAVYKYFKDIND